MRGPWRTAAQDALERVELVVRSANDPHEGSRAISVAAPIVRAAGEPPFGVVVLTRPGVGLRSEDMPDTRSLARVLLTAVARPAGARITRSCDP